MAAAMEIPAPPAQDPPMQQYRGAALNQPFDMRARMKASREKPMLGFWYGAFPDVSVARMVGQAGYDFVMIDWEHTPYSELAALADPFLMYQAHTQASRHSWRSSRLSSMRAKGTQRSSFGEC